MDAELFRALHEGVADLFVRLDGAVEVAIVDAEELAGVNGIVGIDPCGHVVELALVLFHPRLRAAETRLFGTGEDDAHFGVLELDARVLHGFEDGDAHIAAGEVVVGAVDGGLGIPHEVHADETGDEHELGDAAPEQRVTVNGGVCVKAEFGHIRNALRAEHRGGNDRKHESDECAEEAGADVQLINRAAELVVDGPVPRRVGVTVEEDARLHFARALLDGGDIVSRLFGEEEIECLLIQHELADHDQEPDRE